MHRQSLLRLSRQYGASPLVELPPPYLAPSLHFSIIRSPTQSSSFSSTAAAAGKDLSKSRGVSAIHRTGPKHPLGVSKYPLPKPVLSARQARDPTPNHGLWEFFPKDKQALSSPEYDIAHGKHFSHVDCKPSLIASRPPLVYPGTPREVFRRSPQPLVGLRQGAQQDSYIQSGKEEAEGRLWRIRGQ